jgi:hypothetical protein
MRTILYHKEEKVVLTRVAHNYNEIVYKEEVITFEDFRMFKSEGAAKRHYNKRIGVYQSIGFAEQEGQA